MVVKGGKHRHVGFVELGALHDDMLQLEGNMFPLSRAQCVLQYHSCKCHWEWGKLPYRTEASACQQFEKDP